MAINPNFRFRPGTRASGTNTRSDQNAGGMEVTMIADDHTQSPRPGVLSRNPLNKIFRVGYNKTGIDSLLVILQPYGFAMPHSSKT